MILATPSDLTPNACMLFEYRGHKHIRRVVRVEHDETFASPSGGGDIFVVHFEPRDEIPDSAEYPPTNEIFMLDPSDLTDVFAVGCELVQLFAKVAVPSMKVTVDTLAKNTPTELREIFERAKAT